MTDTEFEGEFGPEFRSEFERMTSGARYQAGDPELVARRHRAQSLMREYNSTIAGDAERSDLLGALLGSQGAEVSIRAPFYVDYGTNIHLGDRVFLNYGCVCLDICPIRIGDGTQIGPMVQLLTADHPRDMEERATGVEFGRPITIGREVWIGGAALILPGVTLGDGAIIGAGAVVTRDVAPGASVAGSPARVIEKNP